MLIPPDVTVELVIVDNNSSDRTPRIIADFAGPMPVVRVNESRQGLSYARNSAIAAASGDYILWTDDDVFVDRQWVAEYANAIRRWPNAAFLGGPILPHMEGECSWCMRYLAHLSGPYSLLDLGASSRPMLPGEFPFGANMAFRTDLLREHPFDCRLGRAGGTLISGEDSEISLRLSALGYRGVWVAGSRVRHRIVKEKQTIRYIWRWYFGNGRTAARVFGPGTTLREAIDQLERSRSAEMQQLKANQLTDSWWSDYFSGPFWLSMTKASAYFWGFQREMSEAGRAVLSQDVDSSRSSSAIKSGTQDEARPTVSAGPNF